MPTYWITIDDGSNPVERYDIELADLQAARDEATRLLGAILTCETGNFWRTHAWILSVHREGLLLFELHALVVEASAVAGRYSS